MHGVLAVGQQDTFTQTVAIDQVLPFGQAVTKLEGIEEVDAIEVRTAGRGPQAAERVGSLGPTRE